MERRGSPSPLDSPEAMAEILAACARGLTPSTAFVAAGYSRALVHYWLQSIRTGCDKNGIPVLKETLDRRRAFLEEIDLAIAQWEREVVENLYTAGFVSRRDAPDWRAHQWLLQYGHLRDHWFQHPEAVVVDLKTKRMTDKEIRTLSETDLLELGEPEWRELLEAPEPLAEPNKQE